MVELDSRGGTSPPDLTSGCMLPVCALQNLTRGPLTCGQQCSQTPSKCVVTDRPSPREDKCRRFKSSALSGSSHEVTAHPRMREHRAVFGGGYHFTPLQWLLAGHFPCPGWVGVPGPPAIWLQSQQWVHGGKAGGG